MTSVVKVLIVDDDHSVADTIALVLTRRGIEAVATYDVHTALQLAANDRPDCAVVDVLLPEMDGVELARHIRERSPRTRILLLTGDPNIADQLSGRNHEVLAKPLEPQDLIDRILQILAAEAVATR